MDPGPWNECVPVRMPDNSKIYMVSNTRQAFELLTQHWPTSHGQAYLAAVDICRAVLDRDSPRLCGEGGLCRGGERGAGQCRDLNPAPHAAALTQDAEIGTHGRVAC